MRTIAIIQARMASTRLPGKVLTNIAGQPMLHYVVNRAQYAQKLDSVVVATSDKPVDEPIVNFCKQRHLPYFCGSEDDVLDRYYQAAWHFGAEVVVRLTADCPLLDPQVIDEVVGTFHNSQFDYVSNTIKPTYPDGLDTEVFSFDALAKTWREAFLKSEREHVTPYIYKNPQLFKIHNVEHTADLSALRWTVDEPADLEFVRAVYQQFQPVTVFGLPEILNLLQTQPQFGQFNNNIRRNEGYLKSLREDEIFVKDN